MARLALNKSTLHRESQRLKSFRQFVPALDMKRRQIMSARQQAREQNEQLLEAREQLRQQVAVQLPMMAATPQIPQPLVSIKSLSLRSVNLVGLHLQEIDQLEIETSEYSRLQVPHWVDHLAEMMEQALRQEVELRLLSVRLEQLEKGLQKTTQRLNLFDKVLIPRTEKNIRKIRIALSDSERAGVVRAKIAKNKRRRMALS